MNSTKYKYKGLNDFRIEGRLKFLNFKIIIKVSM